MLLSGLKLRLPSVMIPKWWLGFYMLIQSYDMVVQKNSKVIEVCIGQIKKINVILYNIFTKTISNSTTKWDDKLRRAL